MSYFLTFIFQPKKLLDLDTTSMVVRLNCLLFAEEELVKLEKLIIERYQRMLTEHQDALQQARKDDGGDSDDSDSGAHSLRHMIPAPSAQRTKDPALDRA